MAENGINYKVHAVCVPFPAQGHITPMLQLAKFLNSKGIYITFVNTEHNHQFMLRSNGLNSLEGTSSFKFETFPDGLPPSDTEVFRDIFPLARSLRVNCPKPFTKLLNKINDPSAGKPRITLIICDVHMPFARDVARDLNDCPIVLFYPPSPCSFLAYAQFDTLLHKGILPLKDVGYLTDGTLNTELDLVASMKGIQLKDLPSFIRTTDENNPIYKYMSDLIDRTRGVPLIFNTYKALDHDILNDITTIIGSPLYSMGPLHCQANKLLQHGIEIEPLECNLWKEDSQSLQWLDSRKPNSVIYVSFGTSTFMTSEQLIEFAWGHANSNYPFLWIVRPDIVTEGSSILPSEFLDEVKDRSLLVSWCAQEKVLKHLSTRVYLSHSGWNSTLESLSSGVPMICWPSYADQPINCWYTCEKLGVGLEMKSVVKRDEVEKVIKEAMDEEKGSVMKMKALELKRLSEEAVSSYGSSSVDCDKFIDYVKSLK